MKPVTILMATYNGGKFLAKQIESIIQQTYTNWELIIRDDGSDDDTVAIVKTYEQTDQRVKYIETKSEHKGSCSNFSELYLWIKANREINYVMFCDQDDIWLPQKIDVSIKKITDLVAGSTTVPAMVYGNLRLIDENGDALQAKIKLLEKVPFNQLIITNYAFGCTMMFNRALCDLMDFIPPKAENHDYWVALVANTLGQVGFIDEAFILYRQHDKNVSSQGSSLRQRYNRYVKQASSSIRQFSKKLHMLQLFEANFKNYIDGEYNRVLNDFLKSFYNKNVLETLSAIREHHLYRNGLLQNLAMLYFVCYNYRSICNCFSSIENDKI